SSSNANAALPLLNAAQLHWDSKYSQLQFPHEYQPRPELFLVRTGWRTHRRTRPCRPRFGDQFSRAPFEAWRVVEWHNGLGADKARNVAGLAGRQVILACRMRLVLLQEHAFDEEQVHS
ncbi:MAG: hypothetical protein ACRERX_12050, partial [Pseudomonas sp.]